MNLNEAIIHCKEKASGLTGCECGEEHAQLAVWLEELKDLKKKFKDYVVCSGADRCSDTNCQARFPHEKTSTCADEENAMMCIVEGSVWCKPC